MASTRRRTSAGLIELLAEEPYRFDFFQAVRLLELWARRAAPRYHGLPVGHDHPPREEAVRFRVLVSHRFPPNSIQSLHLSGDAATPPEMVVAFLGLIGPSGVLPQHYTQLAIERVRQKDTSLRDFLDIFHHRLISFFFRAWEKYRHALGYEQAQTQELPLGSDPYTQAVFSLAGFGTAQLRGRLDVPDDSFLYYSGLFAGSPPTAVSLERLIEDYFGFPTAVDQFHGQWLQLETSDQTRLSPSTREANNQLGVLAVAGQRVWGVENRFRLRLGPLCYADFRRLMPDGELLPPIAQFVRTYVGPEFDFDVQPVLRAAEVPVCQLGGDRPGSQLGWNTWLVSQPAQQDARDACFAWPEHVARVSEPSGWRRDENHSARKSRATPGESNTAN